jgi:bacterioferritin-associated ferredoxin
MYVCLCNGVTDRDIRETLAAGAETVEEVMLCTGAGTRCGSCIATVAAMVDASQDGESPSRRCLTVIQPASSAA